MFTVEESSEFLKPVDSSAPVMLERDLARSLENMKTKLHPPSNAAFFTYNRVAWKLQIRKEVNLTKVVEIKNYFKNNFTLLSCTYIYCFEIGVFSKRGLDQPSCSPPCILSSSTRHFEPFMHSYQSRRENQNAQGVYSSFIS